MEIMTTRGWRCHTRAAPSCDIFNLRSSYFHVPLTTVRHLLTVPLCSPVVTPLPRSSRTQENTKVVFRSTRRSTTGSENFAGHSITVFYCQCRTYFNRSHDAVAACRRFLTCLFVCLHFFIVFLKQNKRVCIFHILGGGQLSPSAPPSYATSKKLTFIKL